MDNPCPTFGVLLRQTRTARGLSASALSRKVGVVRSVVSAWEHDKALPELGRLYLVVRALRAGQDVAWRLVVAAGVDPQERAVA